MVTDLAVRSHQLETEALEKRLSRLAAGVSIRHCSEGDQKHSEAAQITRSSDLQIFRSSDHQILRSSDHQIFRSSDVQIVRFLDPQIFTWSDSQILRPSDPQTFRPSDPQTRRPGGAGCSPALLVEVAGEGLAVDLLGEVVLPPQNAVPVLLVVALTGRNEGALRQKQTSASP